mgnify:CR=1 FL=1
MKKLVLIAAAALCALAVSAAVAVKDVSCRQRYPWNGLVDIDYTVESDDAAADVYVFPQGKDNVSGVSLQMRTLSGEGADGPVKPGTWRMTWNAAKDQPNFNTTSFSVKMTAISGAAPYLVIDLSGGANAANYPVRFAAAGPDLASDVCRTTELWLKLILPGTFTMGSPTDELGRSTNETQHAVTLTKPFYMGIFQMTQKQYKLVMGANPSRYTGDTRPVEQVSYYNIRGAFPVSNWPAHAQVDATSFLGKIRARTALNFDLPTEAQWEYACRAGTTTALNNGRDLSSTVQDAAMDEVGRYWYNRSDGKGGYSLYHTKVGSYMPNAWGLYDMHGNVSEWCLDRYGSYATGAVTDPVGSASGFARVLRGGFSSANALSCRSASRFWRDPSYGDRIYYGFRLCCSAGQ